MTNTQVSHAPDAPPPSSACQIADDVELALLLASASPSGDLADGVRERLRGYIRGRAPGAEGRARGLADGRERDIAVRGVAHARAVADDPVHDPAANLRLLAMGVRMILRYGSEGTGVVR
ncbi:DUF6415 family natural product biosynthesis protein [Streptomyces sp. NPDC050585]|uniref:DUF6415 family natural product biosynthesis protein n=1 Tax=Streptomyces sp. NPDC050585 TaxID=3365632 RepID=UPI0037B1732D